MSDKDIESLVLASTYQVEDVDKMWSLIEQRHLRLMQYVRHVVVYVSISEPGRVFVTVGIRHSESVQELLRSPAMFQWFDSFGVQDIPAIFIGKRLVKINLDDRDVEGVAPSVIVGVFATVDYRPALARRLRDGRHLWLKNAGVKKLRVYEALANRHEVMILHEMRDGAVADRWIAHPGADAEWMSRAGLDGYPRPFVGSLAHSLKNEPPG